MWDLIVSVPDHCLSFYLARKSHGITSRPTLYGFEFVSCRFSGPFDYAFILSFIILQTPKFFSLDLHCFVDI